MTEGKSPPIIPGMRDDRDVLLAEIAAFIKRHGLTDTTFSRRAANDGKFVGRLRKGGGITTATAAHIRKYMSDCDRGSPPPARKWRAA